VKLSAGTAGQRLDHAIAELLCASGQPVSVREVRSAIKEGRILVEGRRSAPGRSAKGSEEISLLDFVPKQARHIAPAPALLERIEVLHEDEQILALNKPSGVHSLPQSHLEADTMLGAAVAHDLSIQSSGPVLEGGAVHRLDHGTSGILVFAKSKAVREQLRSAFRNHEIKKTYLAIVSDPESHWHEPKSVEFALNTSQTKVKIDETGLKAHTQITPVRTGAKHRTLIRAETEYGRRHQVRIHLAASGTPILGDQVYGELPPISRLALHAARLLLPKGLVITSKLPEDLERLLE